MGTLAVADQPLHIDLQRDAGLTITWQDGRKDFLSNAVLRRMSPSAEARHLRDELSRNPLTVLPASSTSGGQPLRAVDANLVGHYAIRIRFSDGHDTGIFSWRYLRGLAETQQQREGTENGAREPSGE